MTDEQKNIVKEVLRKIIFQIRTNSVFNLVFTYYVSDYVQMMHENKIKINYDFKSIKLQIQRKILTQRNNYWDLEESKIKLVEDLAIYHEEEFNQFEDFVTNLFASNINLEKKAMEQEEIDAKMRLMKKIREILKEKADTCDEVCYKIIKDEREYPCKSDKIKILLDVGLSVDIIFMLLMECEKWRAQRGYIEKYRKERYEAMLEGKKKRIDPQIVIENVLRQLNNVE